MAANSTPGQQFWKYVREYLTVHMPGIRCCSAHTVDSYRRSIGMYCEFLEAAHRIKFAQVSWHHFTRASVLDYIRWLRLRPCAVATCNLRLSALKAFLRYCADEDVALYSVFQEVNNIPALKMARTPVGYLSKKALMAVLAQPDMTTVKGRRNGMIMILLYDTGARVQELVDMRVTDLHLDAGAPFVVVTGKGNKSRSVPLMDKTVAHLKEYLRHFHSGSGNRDEAPLFYSLRAGRPHILSTDAISVLVKKYGESARTACAEVPPRVHPHLFRHSRAMHLYQSGMPLPYIADFLGHASVTTTEIYACADVTMLRKALEQADPGLVDQTPAWKNEESLRRLCGLQEPNVMPKSATLSA